MVQQFGATLTTTTDLNGDFSFTGLVAGPVTIQASTTEPAASVARGITLAPGPNSIELILGTSTP